MWGQGWAANPKCGGRDINGVRVGAVVVISLASQPQVREERVLKAPGGDLHQAPSPEWSSWSYSWARRLWSVQLRW